MFHISWWYVLLAVIYPVTIYLIDIILRLIDDVQDVILLILYKISKNIKYLNLAEKDIFYPLSNKFLKKYFFYGSNISIIIYVVCLIIIPINNIVYSIRLDIKSYNIRCEKNKAYLINKNYNYYKISSNNPNYRSDCNYIYYIYSDKTIEQLLQQSYIQINKDLYVKPQTIVKISLEDFVNHYPETIQDK